MPPKSKSPKPVEVQPVEKQEPILEILDDLIPADLHASAWTACRGKGWYFGHGSNADEGARFWKLDLEGVPPFDTIWEKVRPRCEALAGTGLKVLRQYANGHTYGLGGKQHFDDTRPGTYTFLYYPNPEWQDGWEGETVFFDPSGEIAFAVRPRPNRGVFFDSRIPHAGRAPSRICAALRVTVAYKLVATADSPKPAAKPIAKAVETAPEKPAPTETAEEVPFDTKETKRDGSIRVYSVRVASDVVDRRIQAHLAKLGETLLLPGFRPGKIPDEVLQKRYGAQARTEILNRLGGLGTERVLPKGSVASAVELKSGAASGDLEFEVTSVYLPDLPALDLSPVAFERLTATDSDLEAVGATQETAGLRLRDHLKSQVLDLIDKVYHFPVLPILVEREFAAIWRAAEAQVQIPADEKAHRSIELRTIAERRLRVGFVISEIGRRLQVRAQNGPELEQQVIDRLIAGANVKERPATQEELRELLKD